jgi:hypothetical protein
MPICFYVAPTDLRVPRTGEPIVVGETVTIPESQGAPRPCHVGLHGSRRLKDALNYRDPGVITVVEITGDVQERDDKLCGRNRKTLAILERDDAEALSKKINALDTTSKAFDKKEDAEYKRHDKRLNAINKKALKKLDALQKAFEKQRAAIYDWETKAEDAQYKRYHAASDKLAKEKAQADKETAKAARALMRAAVREAKAKAKKAAKNQKVSE